jgi:hypothetical protein
MLEIDTLQLALHDPDWSVTGNPAYFFYVVPYKCYNSYLLQQCAKVPLSMHLYGSYPTWTWSTSSYVTRVQEAKINIIIFFHQPYYLLTFSNKPSCVIWILIIFRWSESSYIMYYCHIKSCALTINHLIIIYGLLHFPVLSGDIYVHMYIYGPCIWPHNNIVQATSSTMHHVCLLHARKKRAGGQGRDRPWCAQLDSL